MLNDFLKKVCESKTGLEIGGPSPCCTYIYSNSKTVDNVVFQADTIWHSFKDKNTYEFSKNKKGTLYINDAVDLSSILTNTYDFVLASHCLEHIANPLKALKEWLRVLKQNGYIILILPEKSLTFDHRRNVTNFRSLLAQYSNNVQEDDLSSLPEILNLHDLSRDPLAGTFEQFLARSHENFKNRCLHHHVYSPDLLKEIACFFNCKYIYTQTIHSDIWFIMQS